MCGIGLIVSGIRIDLSSILLHDSTPPTTTTTNNNHELPNQPLVSIYHLKTVLQRRGPDSLGIKRLLLHCVTLSPDDPPVLVSALEDGSLEKQTGETIPVSNSVAELYFIGATLQLRGLNPIAQPFVHPSGNILIYNGEIFGGIEVEIDCNDGEVLFRSLTSCCSCNNSVADVLSRIEGPWAVIYWQASTKTLWFGRDAFGRRSLLVHWPNAEDSRFLLSSVSSFPSVDQSSDSEVENGTNPTYWDELSCGIYSLSVHVSNPDGSIYGHLKRHEWANTMLMDLIKWERVSVQPKPENLNNLLDRMQLGSATSVTAQSVLRVLRESVMRRTSLHQIFQANTCDGQEEDQVPVSVLFSGGLDSMILAALLEECLDPRYGIDLLNVSFDGANAPDRISARTGLKELKGIAPSRRWKLVEINADLSKLTSETKHVMSLIHPANTYMDLNIGTALWLAARGDGWVFKGTGNNDENLQCFRYKSTARIILVGSGADEQCAGYGRHRTKYRCGSWLGLNEEMKLDMQRIWKRNMGRDDRCIADNGKEARFPFLDEDVIRNLLDIPLWEIANLDQPSGTGDKKILREVARMLGLYEAAVLPKRAIQFGSRIARESNRRNFGSNRAANQASAGSVVINSA